MTIPKLMALLFICTPIAVSLADDLVDGNGDNGSNSQIQLPKTKADANRYLARRAAEALGILPKIERSFALSDSTGASKHAVRSLDFKANADLRDSWRKIEYTIALKETAGQNRQAARSLEFKANADLRSSWRTEFKMGFM